MEFLKSLNWTDNWFWYILIGIMTIFALIFTFKIVIAKFKQLFRFLIVVLIGILILYTLHLAGVVSFDILRLLGLESVTDRIKDLFRIKETIGLEMYIII